MCYDNGDDNILMHDVINIRPVVENIFFDIHSFMYSLLADPENNDINVCMLSTGTKNKSKHFKNHHDDFTLHSS